MKKLILFLALLLVTGLTKAQNDNALYFDNVNDFVLVKGASSLISNSTPISISCWVYPENAAPAYPDFDGFCGFRNDTNADFYMTQVSATKVEARFRNSAGTAFNLVDSSLLLNTWQHYVLTYDSTNMRMYRNGVLSGSVPANGKIINSIKDFYIGNSLYYITNFYFKGKIDEVSLWNKALSANEIYCIYKSAIDPVSPGLQLYYKFNQGVANGNNASIDSLIPQAGTIKGALKNFTLTGALSNWVTGLQNYTNTSAIICPGQSVTFGTQTLTIPGIYYENYTGASGCDSIVKMDLTPALSTNVLQFGNSLAASQSNAVYQWLDCNNGYSPIVGEVSQNFAPAFTGDYAVAVTYNSCTDTSNCYNVIIGYAGEQNATDAIRISPNPASDQLLISNVKTATSLEIFSVTGQKMWSEKINSNQKIDISFLAKGVYFIKMKDAFSKRAYRLIKN
jgi:hypothetical protein